MNTSMSMESTAVHQCDSLNYVASDAMPRDRTQSSRLHEPTQMITTIDPISGRDIEDLAGKPYIVDGNIAISTRRWTIRCTWQITRPRSGSRKAERHIGQDAALRGRPCDTRRRWGGGLARYCAGFCLYCRRSGKAVTVHRCGCRCSHHLPK